MDARTRPSVIDTLDGLVNFDQGWVNRRIFWDDEIYQLELERLFARDPADRTPQAARELLGPCWDDLAAAEPTAAALFSGPEDPQLALWLDSASALLDRYFALEDPAGVSATAVETRIEAALPGAGDAAPVPLRGILDRLDDDQREQPTERELPDPRRGVEVGERLVHQRQVHRVRERGPADGEQRAGEPPVQVGPVPPGRDRDTGHDQRREQVELTLDGQRPEVLDDARRVVAGRVVDRVVCQLPVLQEQQRRDRLPDGRHPPVLRQQPEPGHHARDEDDRHRR